MHYEKIIIFYSPTPYFNLVTHKEIFFVAPQILHVDYQINQFETIHILPFNDSTHSFILLMQKQVSVNNSPMASKAIVTRGPCRSLFRAV